MKSALSATSLALALAAPVAAADPPAARLHLDNGITAILVPTAAGEHIAVESLYRVGFMHEPAGLAQAAHLVEHLVCRAATRGAPANQTFDRLASRGMVNAETLADWTHYDYVLPAGNLEVILQAEAARLTSLTIDAGIIEQEVPRAYSEVDAVERSPQAPVFKFAIMAANQVWRYSERDVKIRSGIDAASIEALRTFHRAWYTPANLTIVIAGRFETADAEAALRAHLADIPGAVAAPAPKPIDWATLPAHVEASWDARTNVALVAWAPPDSPAERAAIGIWFESLLGRLMRDDEMTAATLSIMGTNSLWPPGELPIFICASLKPGADAKAVAAMLTRKIADAAAAASPADAAIVAQGAAGFAADPAQLLAMFRQQAKALAHRPDADQLVLGSAALQIGIRALLVGPDPAGWSDRIAGAAKGLPAVLRSPLTAEAAKVLVLQPHR